MVTVKNNKDIGTQAAEEGLLSSILYKPDKIIEIIDELNPELFSVKEFGVIYRCIIELWKENIIPDEVTVINRAVNLGFNITPELIKKLANSNTFVAKRQLKKYCEIIKLHAFKRKTNIQLEEFLENNKNTTQSPEKFVGELLNLAIDLQDKMKAEDNLSEINIDTQNVLDKIQKRYDNYGMIFGQPSGFPTIDKYLDGFGDGEIITIGGANGSGKSMVADNIIINMAKHAIENNIEGKLLFLSLEMTKQQVYDRFISIYTGIQSEYLANPRKYFFDNHIEDNAQSLINFKKKIADAISEINKLPIMIDDSSVMSADMACGAIKKIKLKYGLIAAIVDYIGCVENGVSGKEGWEDIDYSYRAFTRTAKDTKSRIIILNQLLKSYKDNKSTGYKPTRELLTGGSAAMRDSQKVLLTWKPDTHTDYIVNHPEMKNKIVVICDKNRDAIYGPMPDVELQFYGGKLMEAKDIMNMNQSVVDGLENFVNE